MGGVGAMTTMNDAEREAFDAWWKLDAEGSENKAAAYEGWLARAAYAQGAPANERKAFRYWCESIGYPVALMTCGDLAAFQAGAAWQRTQVAGWIPVSERLPSVVQEVIVHSEFDGVTAGFLDSYGEWYAPNSDYKLTRVVAWQPFPAAPALAASTGREVKPHEFGCHRADALHARIEALAAAKAQLLAALEAITYQSDGRIFIGVHSDADVTADVGAAVAAARTA